MPATCRTCFSPDVTSARATSPAAPPASMLTCTSCGERWARPPRSQPKREEVPAPSLQTTTRSPNYGRGSSAPDITCRRRRLAADRLPSETVVSASSEAPLEQTEVTEFVSLAHPRMLSLPLGEQRLEAVALRLKLPRATRLRWRLYAPDPRGFWIPGAKLAENTLELGQGDSWRELGLALEVDPGYVHLAIATTTVKPRSEPRPRGAWPLELALPHSRFRRSACRLESSRPLAAAAGGRASMGRQPRLPVLVLAPRRTWLGRPTSLGARVPCKPQTDSDLRRTRLGAVGATNHERRPRMAERTARGATRIREVPLQHTAVALARVPRHLVDTEAIEIYLDSDLDRHLANIWYSHPPGMRAIPTLLADLDVDTYDIDGRWRRAAEIRNNYRRRCRVAIDRPIRGFRISCLATHGETSATVMDVRARQRPTTRPRKMRKSCVRTLQTS